MIKGKLLSFFKSLDENSKVKYKDLKIDTVKGVVWNTLLLTLFCFSFTYTYFEWYGVLYFHHFDYSDIYNFTISRISVFFSSALYILLVLVSFLGFYITKNKSKKYFTNLQVIMLKIALMFPLLYIMFFMFSYSKSTYSVIRNSFILLFLVFAIYKHQKEKHDVFLIVIIAFTLVIGKLLGEEFAKERFKAKDYINLIDVVSENKILKSEELVIGQNNSQYIIINKKDTSYTFYPKSDKVKVTFKGKIKK
ncbi:hypothetical protein ABHQ57_00390 [Tenacibaculum sp. ZH5_bin.1]|uniref:hypothetical protein n=1 Tax=unclassified Tenacibaculum TaxID=2635139 RepID=UPI0036EB7620